MGKGKEVVLYRIYAIRVVDGKKKNCRTVIAFTSDDQAEGYCRYLSRTHGDEYTFGYNKETSIIYKKASDLIKDPNEDSILFS